MLTTDDKEEIKRLVGETLAQISSAEQMNTESVVEATARAMEVFGTREKALRWLRTPVRSLGDQTPLSLLNSSDGLARVQDVLGRVEHGVW
jgi:putative toxin-antitoxin system antitoxin component (TIGR02293 family)